METDDFMSMSDDMYYTCLCTPLLCFLPENFTFNSTYFSSDGEYSDSDYSIDDSFCHVDDDAINLAGRITLILTYALTVTLTIIGNTMVIVVLLCGSRTMSELNKFIVNLAVGDMAMGIFCMPFTFIHGMLRKWIFGEAMCPLILFLQQVSVGVSIYTLTAIGINRYQAVTNPIKAKVSTSRTKFIILGIWVLSLIISIEPLINARAVLKESRNGDWYYQCDEHWSHHSTSIVYEVCMFLFVFAVPLGVLGWTYTKTAVIIWKRSLPGNAHSNRDAAHLTAKKKILKMLIVIVIAFAVCWLPLNIFNIIITIDQRYLKHSKYYKMVIGVYLTCHWLAMANSFLNPFVYTFLNDTFRGDLKRLIKRIRHNDASLVHRRRFGFSVSSNDGPSRSLRSTLTTTVSSGFQKRKELRFAENNA
ncbi:prolactin-releasing peptide receptor-like [Saccoglossus kowalevskii]|uniref:Neuropeptide Y receptor-like n=1 Tax=Saccoglossus kowalevskii TaxID=10224 RepID=A0ABM0GPW0_SACKO|nr:PREDICTED: neuropeptide Y receptor-like [Saccoglossus kowalevskii]